MVVWFLFVVLLRAGRWVEGPRAARVSVLLGVCRQ
jgi:hypothetical protein